jgi:hypothetical protein
MMHLLLILFTTMQVLLTLQGQSDITRSQERAFGRFFFDENQDFNDVDHPRFRNFYDVPTFRAFVLSSMTNFYSINTKSLEYFEYEYT